MNDYQAMLIARANRQEIDRHLRHAELVHEATQIEKAQSFRLRFFPIGHISGLSRFAQPRQRSLITLKTIGRRLVSL